MSLQASLQYECSPLTVGHSPVPPAAAGWDTEGTLPARLLCLLNVSPTVSRSLRNLVLGLNSGYSPYSLQAEGFSLCLCCLQWQQQAGPSPSGGSGLGLGQQGGTGGAEEILPWAWSSYREGTAGRRAETSCTQDYSSSVSLWESLICSLVLEKSTWQCWGCTALCPLQGLARAGVSEERDSVSPAQEFVVFQEWKQKMVWRKQAEGIMVYL